MFYSIDGNIVKLEGGFPKRKVNTLSFQVYGDKFPARRDALNYDPTFGMRFLKPEDIVVNWGDGNTSSFTTDDFLMDENNQYTYQDNETGPRIVTFTFSDLSNLVDIYMSWAKFIGVFPVELGAAENLETMSLTRIELNSFPNSLSNLSNLKIWVISNALESKLNKIEDGLFNSDIEVLTLDSSYSLGDVISSNLFKINQFKDSLKHLDLRRTDLTELPESIRECTKLEYLGLDFSNFSEFPKQIESLINLEKLSIGYGSFLNNNSFIDFSNLLKLETLSLRISNLKLDEIPTKWKGLKSLTTFINFDDFINSDIRFNEFIGYFYTLCTNETYLDTSTPTAQADEYTNKFRDISWGDSSLTPTGTYQAPTGFVRGSNNGNPTNAAEKIYVLVNNYGHTVTFNQP